MIHVNFYAVKQVIEKRRKLKEKPLPVKSPQDAYNFINKFVDLSNYAAERFGILCLNAQYEVIGIHVLSIGTLQATLVSPREIFQAALLNSAATIVLYHNHPSGDPTPSTMDIQITKSIALAGEIMGIEVIDHIVVGHECYKSLKESELF